MCLGDMLLLTERLREQTLSKMEKMQDEGNKTWLEVQFMKQATSQLIEARQILQVQAWLAIEAFSVIFCSSSLASRRCWLASPAAASCICFYRSAWLHFFFGAA